MTLTELVTTVTTWAFAREAGDRISKDIRNVRQQYIGKEAHEVMPNGNRVKCVITAIDWEDSYGMTGGWAVQVIFTEGNMRGFRSWTSDNALEFWSK